jgi:hypothetical protein
MLSNERWIADLFFDGSKIFRWEANKFDTDSNAGQAVADFRPRMNFDTRAAEAEAKFHDRAFGEAFYSINEHAMGTEVGRSHGDFLGATFISQ